MKTKKSIRRWISLDKNLHPDYMWVEVGRGRRPEWYHPTDRYIWKQADVLAFCLSEIHALGLKIEPGQCLEAEISARVCREPSKLKETTRRKWRWVSLVEEHPSAEVEVWRSITKPVWQEYRPFLASWWQELVENRDSVSLPLSDIQAMGVDIKSEQCLPVVFDLRVLRDVTPKEGR